MTEGLLVHIDCSTRSFDTGLFGLGELGNVPVHGILEVEYAISIRPFTVAGQCGVELNKAGGDRSLATYINNRDLRCHDAQRCWTFG